MNNRSRFQLQRSRIPRLNSRGPIEAVDGENPSRVMRYIPRLNSRGPIEAKEVKGDTFKQATHSAAEQPRPH